MTVAQYKHDRGAGSRRDTGIRRPESLDQNARTSAPAPGAQTTRRPAAIAPRASGDAILACITARFLEADFSQPRQQAGIRLRRVFTRDGGPNQSSPSTWPDLEVHALLRLRVSEDAKQVLGRRVAIWPKHPHQAVRGDGCRLFQLPEANGGVDVVTQDSSARLLVAGEHELNGFTQQCLAELRFLLGALPNCFAEVFRRWHAVRHEDFLAR